MKNWNKLEFGHIMKDQIDLQNIMQTIQYQIIIEGRYDTLVTEEGRVLT